MSKSINKVILVGFLGDEPRITAFDNGDCVANLSLATGESWKNKETGTYENKTDWHPVVFFGKQADFCRMYVKKGDMVYVCGKLRNRKWTDKSGVVKYKVEVHGSEVQIMSSKSKSTDDNYDSSYQDNLSDDEKDCVTYNDIPF